MVLDGMHVKLHVVNYHCFDVADMMMVMLPIALNIRLVATLMLITITMFSYPTVYLSGKLIVKNVLKK